MSSKIFTPVNQVKLTNVSVVRLKKGGKRFELACYKNKVQDYRNKLTKDLDEVLQIHSIFLNVSKGQTAKDSDLQSSFGTTDVDTVILEILNRGDLQVGAEERGQHLQMMTREVATIIAEKCVNPRTRTPYPVGMIEQAIAELHFSPNLTRSAKQQALEVIKGLEKQTKFPIARAQMRLLVEVPVSDIKRVMEAIRPMIASVEEERNDGVADLKLTCLIDPGQFRPLTESVAKLTKGRGIVNLLSLKDLKDASSPIE
ncbi:SBDS family rRNA metabolism protein [Paramicrosporidium saccamoebae]|uniref:Ribosome maturation protein SDO1 n=1 Tax=Paramicrosporidium saccamoebae TaxID=1246581 RepID=A0A2H9TIC7_9FUNG|nr:SBDS family rRNA metabolism protein [Paramicrosporidium saccamoebae]